MEARDSSTLLLFLLGRPASGAPALPPSRGGLHTAVGVSLPKCKSELHATHLQNPTPLTALGTKSKLFPEAPRALGKTSSIPFPLGPHLLPLPLTLYSSPWLPALFTNNPNTHGPPFWPLHLHTFTRSASDTSSLLTLA